MQILYRFPLPSRIEIEILGLTPKSLNHAALSYFAAVISKYSAQLFPAAQMTCSLASSSSSSFKTAAVALSPELGKRRCADTGGMPPITTEETFLFFALI